MKQRAVYIEDAKTLSDTGTCSIDLKTGAPISYLELIFGGTKGTTENYSDKISEYITKIEVVDGADVLWSLSMQEAIALNAIEMGEIPAHDNDVSASGTGVQSCFINFGLYPFDLNHYLNVADYRNLQLKVTTALTAAVTTYVTNTLTIDVIAHVIDEGAGSYDGYLMAKEHYSWTLAASGDETVDLPRDFPYRFIMVKAFEDNKAVSTKISNVKMTCDADRFIIFDYATGDLILRNRSKFGFFHETLQSTCLDNDNVDSILFDIAAVSIRGATDDEVYQIGAITGNRFVVESSYGNYT